MSMISRYWDSGIPRFPLWEYSVSSPSIIRAERSARMRMIRSSPERRDEPDGLDEQIIAQKDRDVGAPLGMDRIRPRRVPALSMMSSWIRLAVWMISTTAARKDASGPAYPETLALRRRRAGRSRLPFSWKRYGSELGDRGDSDEADQELDVPFDLVHSVPDLAEDLVEEGGAPAGLGAGPSGIERRHRKFVNCMWIPRSLDLRKAMIS